MSNHSEWASPWLAKLLSHDKDKEPKILAEPTSQAPLPLTFTAPSSTIPAMAELERFALPPQYNKDIGEKPCTQAFASKDQRISHPATDLSKMTAEEKCEMEKVRHGATKQGVMKNMNRDMLGMPPKEVRAMKNQQNTTSRKNRIRAEQMKKKRDQSQDREM